MNKDFLSHVTIGHALLIKLKSERLCMCVRRSMARGQCARLAIVEVKQRLQRLSDLCKRCLTSDQKCIISTPPCLGRHVNPSVAFAIVSIHQFAMGPRGTYIPLTLYPRRGSRGISADIPLIHPRFTKIC
jgi:hypothetical protein